MILDQSICLAVSKYSSDYQFMYDFIIHINHHHHNPYIYLNLALCSLKLNKLDEAQNAITKASQIDDENPKIWAYLLYLINIKK